MTEMTQLSFTMLPAYEGDALVLRWAGHVAYIDLGRIGTGRRIAKDHATAGNQTIELLVVTHVDFDHIGGVLSGLVDPDSPMADVEINDIWFNGYRHLLETPPADPQVGELEEYGVQHGFELEQWLRDGQPWNRAFDGGPVVWQRDTTPIRKDLADGLTVWIIGPPPDRLSPLEPEWKDVIDEETARPEEPELLDGRLERYGREFKIPVLEDRIDLEDLAATNNVGDTIANGSSIALIVEWCGRRLLLAGDAYPDDLLAGARAVDPNNLHFDVVKVPHHGSRNNVTTDFTNAITADYWAVSTNGNTHKHPDPPAIGRILLSNLERTEAAGLAPIEQQLMFNVPSDENEIWDHEDWPTDYSYRASYGTKADGLTISLTPKPDEPEQPEPGNDALRG